MQVIDPGRIRRRRKAKHFSQRELAFLVRRTQSTIYLIETGRLRNVSEDLACSIAARLDVDVEDLFLAQEAAGVVDMPHGSHVESQASA